MQKFLRGQVWFYSEPQNTVKKQEQQDSVQRGSRPVVIISNNTGNKHSPVITVVPCTTQGKTDIPTHFNFILDGTYNTVLCEQIFTVGKPNLTTYRGTLEQAEIELLDKCISSALGMNNTVSNNWLHKEKILICSKEPAEDKPTNSNYDPKASKNIRTKAQKEEIVNAFCDAESKQELEDIAIKYGFTSVKMLSQSVGRWMNK